MQLEIPQDSSPAEWIEAELSGDVGSVTGIVPDRYESYVRIFHPATTKAGEPISWSQVANALGRKMHSLAQWHSVVGSENPDDLSMSKWRGDSPERGNLPLVILKAICTALSKHTQCPERCFFGVWSGWRLATAWARQQMFEEWQTSERCEAEVRMPRFGLPPLAGRDYFLLIGPLQATVKILELAGKRGSEPPSPSYIWPADRSWFLASDIDLDSTLVGGSNDLVDSILEIEQIEARHIAPNGSLMADSDCFNSLPSLKQQEQPSD